MSIIDWAKSSLVKANNPNSNVLSTLLIVNLSLAITISYMKQSPIDRVHRQKYFDYIENQTGIAFLNRRLVPAAIVLGVFFIIFGFGPGAIIGNELFGIPDDPTTWAFGIPSIWVWQILFW